MISIAVTFAKRLLTSPKYLLVLLTLTFVLHMASIVAALKTDDYLQWAALSGSDVLFDKGFVVADPSLSWYEQIGNQFNFFDAKNGSLAQLIDYGALPWWTETDIKIHFFRPISSLTHWVDYNFWPNNIIWMHFENLLIFMLLVFAVYRLYQKTTSSAGIAALAALIYSLDPSHLESLTWVASRNALLAPLFAMLAIQSFIQWRETDRITKMYLSLIFLLCALLSAEAGIATTCYLFSYMLWIDKAPLGRRIIALMPAAGLVIVWRIAYNYAGFGSENVAQYVDPGHDPLFFAKHLIDRFPQMIASANFVYDGGTRRFSLAQEHASWIYSWAITALICLIYYPVLKRDKYSRFWMTGAMIAVIPLSTINVITARLFEFVAIGFFAVLASYAQWAFSNLPSRNIMYTSAVRLLAGIWLIVNIGLASQVLAVNSISSINKYAQGDVEEDPFPFYNFDNMDYQDRYLVVANAPYTFLLQFVPYRLAYHNLPIPAGIRSLTPGLSTLSIKRLNEQELLVDIKGGFSIYSHIDIPGEVAQSTLSDAHNSRKLMGFFGRSDRIYSLGQQFNYDDTRIEITKLLDGRPKAIKVTFNYPLDQEKYLFVYWDWESQRYRELVLPKIGEQIILKGPFYQAETLQENKAI